MFYKPREQRSLKRSVFRFFLKEETDGELRTFIEREFQILAAWKWKDLLPADLKYSLWRCHVAASIHPPEMEINYLKTACGCQCGGLIKMGHTRNPLTLRNTFVNVKLHIYQSIQLGNATTAATRSTQQLSSLLLSHKSTLRVLAAVHNVLRWEHRLLCVVGHDAHPSLIHCHGGKSVTASAAGWNIESGSQSYAGSALVIVARKLSYLNNGAIYTTTMAGFMPCSAQAWLQCSIYICTLGLIWIRNLLLSSLFVILRNLVLPGISNFQNDFRWCAMDYEMHSATLQSKEERGSHLPQYSQCKCSNPHQAWILSLVQTAPLVVVF